MTADEIIRARLTPIAEDCASDALEILQIISVLREENKNNINKGLTKAGAGRAANAVQNALIARLTLLVVRSYSKSRKGKDGDLCARKAWEIIDKDKRVEDELMRRSQAGTFTAAKAHWARCRGDVRLQRLEHFRDKYTAHKSEPDPEIPIPKFEELFSFAEDTANSLNVLSNIIRTRSDNLADWDGEISGSATAFWKPWAS